MAICDDLEYEINNVSLNNPDLGFKLLVGTEYAPSLNPRKSTLDLPGVHGSVPIWTSPMGTITVALVVRVLGGTPDVLRQRWDNLTGLLGSGTNSPVLLSRVRGENVDVADARLVTTTAPTFDKAQPWVSTTIVLEIPSGRWGQDYIEETFTNSGAGQTSSIALASSTPVSDALIRVAGPLATVSVRDLVSDTGVAWGGAATIPSGEFLIIDVANMRAWRRTDDAWTAGGVDVSATLVHVGLRPLSLVSRVVGDGLGGITKESEVATASSGTGGTTVITMRARPTVA